MSVVNVVCCIVEVCATGRSLVWWSPADGVSLSVISCNSNALHYKVYVDRGRTKKKRKQNARLKEEDRVWHIPPLLLRRFRLYAVSSQRLRVQPPYFENATSANP